MHDVLEIIKNIQGLYENNSSLAILKDFERVLDEMDIYAYENWIDGELAAGPKVDRHWITASFMWPLNKMPDPEGGKRLLDLGCKVRYKKTHLIEPRKIRKPDDIRPGTKKGKLDRKPIWIVEIEMPKEVAFDIYKGYMDKMKNEDLQKNPSSPAAMPASGPAPTAPVSSPVAAPGMAPGVSGPGGGTPPAPAPMA